MKRLSFIDNGISFVSVATAGAFMNWMRIIFSFSGSILSIFHWDDIYLSISSFDCCCCCRRRRQHYHLPSNSNFHCNIYVVVQRLICELYGTAHEGSLNGSAMFVFESVIVRWRCRFVSYCNKNHELITFEQVMDCRWRGCVPSWLTLFRQETGYLKSTDFQSNIDTNSILPTSFLPSSGRLAQNMPFMNNNANDGGGCERNYKIKLYWVHSVMFALLSFHHSSTV